MVDKPKIGIVGAGFVGGAIARGFSLTADVKIYDKDPKRSVHSFEDICNSEFIFLCLPTPMEHVEGGKADLSIVHSVCQQFKNSKTEGILIIKSTVPIGTTLMLQEKYGLSIIHNPEFLTARNADIDFITPARTILGGPPELTSRVAKLFADRFPGTNIFELTSNESEAVKYIANAFFAVKVIFFNEVFLGLKDAYGLDWGKVMRGVLTDGRIGISHYEVPGHDGKFGFGGSCVLPDACVKSWKHDAFEEPEEKSIEDFVVAYEKQPNNDRWYWCIEGCDASAHKIEWKKVTKVSERVVNEELFEFHTDNGVFTCTGDHLMPIQRDGQQVLISAKKIKNTDKLFSKLGVTIGTTKINKITRKPYKGKVYNLELESNDKSADDLFWIEQKTGIAGHNCLPKDICSLIAQIESVGFDPKLLKAAWEQNKAVRPEMDWGRIPSSVSRNKRTEFDGG